jgi:hypothetical protein
MGGSKTHEPSSAAVWIPRVLLRSPIVTNALLSQLKLFMWEVRSQRRYTLRQQKLWHIRVQDHLLLGNISTTPLTEFFSLFQLPPVITTDFPFSEWTSKCEVAVMGPRFSYLGIGIFSLRFLIKDVSRKKNHAEKDMAVIMCVRCCRLTPCEALGLFGVRAESFLEFVWGANRTFSMTITSAALMRHPFLHTRTSYLQILIFLLIALEEDHTSRWRNSHQASRYQVTYFAHNTLQPPHC